METVTEQPIKKIEFFRCPQSLPGVAPLTKKPEDSGYEIDSWQVDLLVSGCSNPTKFYVTSAIFANDVTSVYADFANAVLPISAKNSSIASQAPQ